MNYQQSRPRSNKSTDPYVVPDDAKFDTPWIALIEDSERIRRVEKFLTEAPQLSQADPRTVALNQHTGAVLFWFKNTNEVKAGGFPFAVVLLNWDGMAEPEMSRRIEYFECWSHWEIEGMARDVADYTRQSSGSR